MKTITDKKIKEWYQWGKDAYKNTAKMMNTNCHHPDYNTKEKREAIHDLYGESYMLNDRNRENLKIKFKYTDEDVDIAFSEFKKGYDSSRAWYRKADAKYQAVLDKYQVIFDGARQIALNVDVSNIKDGFPCGSAHLYLQKYPETEDLYEALGHFSGDKSDAYKYKLPIEFPTYGQCIAFDEAICAVVSKFLREQGIFTHTHTWVD